MHVDAHAFNIDGITIVHCRYTGGAEYCMQSAAGWLLLLHLWWFIDSCLIKQASLGVNLEHVYGLHVVCSLPLWAIALVGAGRCAMLGLSRGGVG